MVLFTVVVLTSVTAVAGHGARRSARLAENRRAQSTARSMAESGVLAARIRLEAALAAALEAAGGDTLRLDAALDDATTTTNAPWLADSVADGAFAVSVVDVSARLDVNRAGAEGFARLLRAVAPRGEAERVAALVAARVRGEPLPTRSLGDPVMPGVVGSDTPGGMPVMHPFESLDELLTVPGMRVEWLEALATELTVDGDDRVNRRRASPRVLAAATGSLVDRPSRLVVVARGWQRGHPLSREISAVYAIEGRELRLVRWRERDL